jgi:hypothetical protein
MEKWRGPLAKANEINAERSRVKRAIKAGELSIADVFEMSCVATMRVEDLLRVQRRWTRPKARSVLDPAGVSVYRLVRDCTPRQLEVMREQLARLCV